MGTKHPRAFGRPGREVWGEVWEAAEAIHHRVFAGETVTLEDHPWTLQRTAVLRKRFSRRILRPSAMRRARSSPISPLLSKPPTP